MTHQDRPLPSNSAGPVIPVAQAQKGEHHKADKAPRSWRPLDPIRTKEDANRAWLWLASSKMRSVALDRELETLESKLSSVTAELLITMLQLLVLAIWTPVFLLATILTTKGYLQPTEREIALSFLTGFCPLFFAMRPVVRLTCKEFEVLIIKPARCALKTSKVDTPKSK